MTGIEEISKEFFGDKRFLRSKNLKFAAKDAFCSLTAQELPVASLAVPVGFVKFGDEFALVALQGLEPNSNLYVSPTGSWRARYVPECYRCYPFLVATNTDGRLVLCFDQNSGLLSTTDEGEEFFNVEGNPTDLITDVLKFLSRNAANRLATAKVCKVLQDLELIKPWPITLDPIDDGGKVRTIEGFFCIDEKRLNMLGDEDFLKVRNAGVLPVIYCQMLSMSHLNNLVHLQKLDKKLTDSLAQKSVELPKELGFDLSSGEGTISFDNL